MSIRRINHTGRKRINRDHARIIMRPGDDGTLTYEAELALESYGFPSDAQVLVEAYRQHSYERFDHGTAGDLSVDRSRALSLFRSGDQVQFRVKVVDTNVREGCLLGEADRLKPDIGTEPGDQGLSLLPAEGRDLGDEAWRLEIEDGPLLLVNNQLGDWKQLARSPAFIWLVFPCVLREILRHILIIEEHHSTDDPSDWQDRWLLAAKSIRGGDDVPGPNTADEFVEQWITDVVDSFARRHHMFARFGSPAFGGGES